MPQLFNQSRPGRYWPYLLPIGVKTAFIDDAIQGRDRDADRMVNSARLGFSPGLGLLVGSLWDKMTGAAPAPQMKPNPLAPNTVAGGLSHKMKPVSKTPVPSKPMAAPAAPSAGPNTSSSIIGQ